jgi:parvulin-like peptidyl-prolyl isomerase
MGRKQARQNRIILLSVAGLGLLIVLVLAIGLIMELAVKPGQPVATVNGTRIRQDDFETLLDYRRYNLHSNINNLQNSMQTIDPEQEGNEFLISFYQQQLEQLQTSLTLAPQDAVDELIEDALIQPAAQEAGITVTAADVEQTINEEIRRAVSPASQEPITDTEDLPTPTPIPQEQLDQVYQSALDNMGLSDKEFRTITQRGLYRTRFQEYLADQVPTTGLVVHPQLIQAETEEEAAAVLERLEAGEDFAIVAQEVSTDTQTAAEGGDLGWVAAGQLSQIYGQELEDEVFALEPGEIRLVTTSDGQFFVVQVLERNENGELPFEVLSIRQNTALQDWLEEQKTAPGVEIENLLEADQIPPDPYALTTAPIVP